MKLFMLATAFLFMMVNTVIMGPLPAVAQTGQTCPLKSKTLKAVLIQKELTGEVGRDAFIEIRLDPPEAPVGFFITSLVDIIESPKDSKASILTGYPRIKLNFDQPGIYVLEIRVNLVAKSSCGGVKATTLLTEKVKVTVTKGK